LVTSVFRATCVFSGASLVALMVKKKKKNSLAGNLHILELSGNSCSYLQYFCREDSIPRPTAPGVTKSRTEPSTHIHTEGAYGDGRLLYIYCGGGYTNLPL